MYLADYEGGPSAPDAVFADPADAMIWADNEYDLTKKWYDADVDNDGEFRCKIYSDYYAVVRPVEFHRFKCEAFIMGGPGSQSKHMCRYDWPHGIEDEHGWYRG